MRRKNKQLIIAFIYLTLFVSLGVSLYFLFTRPSCFDQKKNGKEEGVDCGEICQKECIQAVSLEKIKTGTPVIIKDGDRFDVLVELENPNVNHGFAGIRYTLNLYAGDQLLGESNGRAYILPKEKKNLIVTGITALGEPDSVKLEIKEGQETFFTASQKPKLEALNLKFGRTTETSTFFEATFQLTNRSPNDFLVVDLEAIVKDSEGRVIALNKGNLNSVLPGDVRDFRFFWPREFAGQPVIVEIRAHSNVLDLENL